MIPIIAFNESNPPSRQSFYWLEKKPRKAYCSFNTFKYDLWVL